jgi:F0F1-type ATP synthase membrane subunit b/b'
MEEFKMKKIAILVASVLVLGGFSTRTFAAEANTQTTQPAEAVVSYKEEAGVTPDSLLYVIDKAVDDLRVVLAGSEEKEAAVNADIAEERLGESEVMAEEGKVELAQKALEEYNNAITEAAAKLQAVVVNLGATSEEAVEEDTDSKLEQSIADLEKAIQGVQEKSLVVLDSLKDVVAEESVEAVEDVIEEQTTHKEAVAKFVAERHEFNAAKKSLNMAKVALKKIEKSGNEADIKAAQDKLTAAQTEYMTAQTELHAAFQAKKAADFGIEEEKEEVDSEEVVTAEENNQAVEETATAEEDAAVKVEAAKTTEYTKTNNGNGNGNKSAKIEKEKKDKENSAPAKSGEEHGKSNQGNGKNK